MKRVISFFLLGIMLVPFCGCSVATPGNDINDITEGTAGSDSAVPSAPSESNTDVGSSAPAETTVAPVETTSVPAETTAAPDTTEAVTEAPTTDGEEKAELPELPALLRIACVGDSITYGVGASNRTKTAYPAMLQTKLKEKRPDKNFVVLNYGRSRAYAINNAEVDYKYASAQSIAYTASPEYNSSLRSKPNIVLIMLGANDAYTVAQNKDAAKKYTEALEKLVNTYRGLETSPEVYLLLCTDRFDTAQRIKDLKNVILPAIEQVAKKLECPVIDMFTLSTEHATALWNAKAADRDLSSTSYYSDSVHPGDKLYELMAEEAANRILKAYK
ncbi:MAG: hypothetical protein E7619_06845 [Ruminococcaceae bacterium]|nr:hypothetical protein [Oscillospiraceae bacterium]